MKMLETINDNLAPTITDKEFETIHEPVVNVLADRFKIEDFDEAVDFYCAVIQMDRVRKEYNEKLNI